MIFSKKTLPPPAIKEVTFQRQYKFMYENFVVSSQHETYLLLEESDGIIHGLKFESSIIYKYGYPNDEVGHPLTKYGLGLYGFFEVENSQWIEEIKENNRTHPSHSDDLFSNDKHFVAKFQDVTFEIIAIGYEEIHIKKNELSQFINKEVEYLKT